MAGRAVFIANARCRMDRLTLYIPGNKFEEGLLICGSETEIYLSKHFTVPPVTEYFHEDDRL
jgi:hypothetical protein